MIQIVINNQLGDYIQEQFESKRLETFKIFNHYAKEVVSYFSQVQTSIPKDEMGKFWTNRTHKAAKSLFTQALARKGELVLNIEYDGDAPWVKYLEGEEGTLGTRFAALPSIVERFVPFIVADLKALYGDAS